MSYTKTTWVNNQPPYINADNLNKIENQLETNTNDISTNSSKIGNLSNLNTTEKSNLVGAINEVTTKQAWNLVDSKTGDTTITLPNSFNELLIIVVVDNNSNVHFTFNIPYQILGSSVKGFNSGYYQNSGVLSNCRVLVSNTSANLTVAFLNNQDKKSTSTTIIYYR